MPDQAKPKPRDVAQPVSVSEIPDGGFLAGAVADEPVLLTRSGDTVQAFGGTCTHLGAPLAKGLAFDGAVRCPWHHACFSLRTGEATTAPAFDALPRWTVERTGAQVRVTGRASTAPAASNARPDHSAEGIVIVGGGAAGYAAAHELRRLGHEGPITLVSHETHAPYDRTLLTKDYLDGRFGDDRLPIAKTTLAELGVQFLGGVGVSALERASRTLRLSDGHALPYTSLLLATGAEPKRLDVPGCDLPHVHVLRSVADCKAIIDALAATPRVAIVGSSFIGLEAAASLRSRDLDVTVVTPEAQPMSKVLGTDLAEAILAVHRVKGVKFEFDAKIADITPDSVRLADGTVVAADLVIVGIGVTPRVALAEHAGLAIDKGVVVDAQLRTSDPFIFAVGDIARWPDSRSGSGIRVEHWAVAERQGQVAARNMIGGSEAYAAVPFFWSKHFDFSFRYVGHAEGWDDAAVTGSLDEKKAVIRYTKAGKVLAVATVGQDDEALRIEHAMEGETGLKVTA